MDNIEITENSNGVFSFNTTCNCGECRITISAENFKFKNVDVEEVNLYFDVTRPEYLWGDSWFSLLKHRVIYAVKCILGMETKLNSEFTFRDKKHLADFIEGLQKIQGLEKHVVGPL